MEQKQSISSRKKFLLWGAAAFSSFAFFRFFPGGKAGEKETAKVETVKMLTEDGKLVEVDISKLPSAKTKISDDGVHNWIKA